MDKFLLKSFKVGKFFSAIAILLSVGTIILAIVLLLLSIKQYKINYYTPEQLESFNKSQITVKKADEAKIIEKEYGDKIKSILINSKFSNDHYNKIINTVSELKPEYRKGYIEHFEDFVVKGRAFTEEKVRKDAQKVDKSTIERFLKRYQKDIEETSISAYNNMYISQVGNIETDKLAANFYRYWLLGIISFSIMLFISFLILPLLIKIEENTRK